ncbi:MAG TPA: hypothetical protein VEG08_02420 [Terriglobales bacterium]|nr:hypothetical protein [Terriglobales bacterium]
MAKTKFGWFFVLAAMVVWTAGPLVAQMASGLSVADAARANQQAKTGGSDHARVYTNEDLGGAAGPAKGASSDAPASAKGPAGGQQKLDAEAQKLRGQILQQKQQVARLQQHLDRLQEIAGERANLATPAPLTPQLCASEPERCEGKRQAALDLARTQPQLAEAQHRLQDMQDKARKQGYSAQVWDP